MVISHLSQSIRYTGRWAKGEEAAVSTSPGAAFEVAFRGQECVLLFDVDMNAEPFPHIYIQVDNGARIETRIEYYIRVDALTGGNHILKVIYKSNMENQPNWHEPLVGKISFIGYESDGEGVLPEDNRKIIEFIGDSITEGVWVDEKRQPYKFFQKNMVFQNDATATYAYLTAEALGMKPYIMGYGSQGLTKGGRGGVPKAGKAYPYYFDEYPAEPSGAEVIVINHGANDQRATGEEYIDGYKAFLDLVRSVNPTAKIVVLPSFYRVFNAELKAMVEDYNSIRGDDILYIDSCGWIPRQPSHPARDGHKIAAERLTQKLKELLKFEE